MDFNLILSDEEYQQKFADNHPAPYVYELGSGSQILFYFGVSHSRDPKDPQWQKLEEQWKEFVKKVSKPIIVFLEGQAFDILDGSRSDLIQKYGESGFFLSLIQDTNTKTVWPDLLIDEEAKQLSEKFEPDLVAYYIFARSAGSWLRSGTMGTFNEVLAKAAVATARRVSGAPADFDSYAQIHERIFKKPLEESQKEAIIRAAAPVYHDSVVNDIARASSRLRNEHVLEEAERYWMEGYSIFLLFGSAHAVIQEQALRDMVEK